jgi:hypothetical protein
MSQKFGRSFPENRALRRQLPRNERREIGQAERLVCWVADDLGPNVGRQGRQKRPKKKPGSVKTRKQYEIQPTQRRAFLKSCIQGESSPEPGGDHDIWTLRNTRSGCGMTIVKRPSGVVRPVMPPAEPLGLYG